MEIQAKLVHRGHQGPDHPARIGALRRKSHGATIFETDSSHVPMLSQPEFVLDVIRKAAASVMKQIESHAELFQFIACGRARE